MAESTMASVLILIGIIVGIILVFGVAIYGMRKIATDFKNGCKEIMDNLGEIGENVKVTGKFFTGLTIGLLKASKEQRSLTGDDLREGLKMVEESKTTEELLEKLSPEKLPAGQKRELEKKELKENTEN